MARFNSNLYLVNKILKIWHSRFRNWSYVDFPRFRSKFRRMNTLYLFTFGWNFSKFRSTLTKFPIKFSRFCRKQIWFEKSNLSPILKFSVRMARGRRRGRGSVTPRSKCHTIMHFIQIFTVLVCNTGVFKFIGTICGPWTLSRVLLTIWVDWTSTL